MHYRRLWICFAAVIVASLAVLGYYGGEIYRQAPPVPERVVLPAGDIVFTGQEIKDGQNVWQSIGGQQLGSVWGHGAYVAPDWSADWLHRECLWLLDRWSQDAHGQPFAELDEIAQSALTTRLKRELRRNTYDPGTGDLTISADRAAAIDALSRYYAAIFGDTTEFADDLQPLADGSRTPAELRSAYAIPALTVRDPERQRQLNAFFFWIAWACATERPQADVTAPEGAPSRDSLRRSVVTYTNNWPAERLVGNAPSGPIVVWSVISFVLLLAGIGALAWY